MVKSQFNYCPLVRMFCSRQSNNLINKVRERYLRLTYTDETKEFLQILREQNEITSKEFTSFNDRSVQNCKRYRTTNNEFSFSILLQHSQHQKFPGSFHRK